MQFKKIPHVVYACDYHLVFATKYRRKIIKPGIFAWMELKLKKMKKFYPLIEIKKINHDMDHLHMLVSIPPTMRVGQVVNILKSNTARELKQKFPFLAQVYYGADSVWSSGYFVSTVGINEEIIRKYIDQQGIEDSGQATLELK